MKKLTWFVILTLGVAVLPAMILAQTNGGGTTPVPISTPVGGPVGGGGVACAVPASPTTASDLLPVLACMQNRISILEARVKQLESGGGSMPLPKEPAQPPLPVPNMPTGSIRAVQGFLNSNANSGLKEDGRFGPKTMAALKAFQEAHNLSVTGNMDQDTLEQMQELMPTLNLTAPIPPQ